MSEPGKDDKTNDHDKTNDPDEIHDHEDESVVDRMRHSGVGVEDPNIVGDVGPTDVPPGGPDPDHEIGDDGARV